MGNKLAFNFVEVKAIDSIEGLMNEWEFDSIIVILKSKNDTFKLFSINGVGCHGNKER